MLTLKLKVSDSGNECFSSSLVIAGSL